MEKQELIRRIDALTATAKRSLDMFDNGHINSLALANGLSDVAFKIKREVKRYNDK